jgi:hypothetical protein
MSTFRELLTPEYERRLCALDCWYRTLENRSLRMDCPDAYHEELIRQADEMDRQGMVSWEQWRDLRVMADQSYLRAIEGGDYKTVAPGSRTYEIAETAAGNTTSRP